MPDIAMCRNPTCEKKNECWRYMAIPSQYQCYAVRRGIEILTRNGVSKYKLMFYVLIGFKSTPEEDLLAG